MPVNYNVVASVFNAVVSLKANILFMDAHLPDMTDARYLYRTCWLQDGYDLWADRRELRNLQPPVEAN